MKKMIIAACLSLLALSALAHAKEQPKPASFKPGASVELVVKVNAPKGWAHNPMMPLKLSFDPEYLKTAPFTVAQNSFEVKFEGHPTSAEVKVPIKLKGSLNDGELSIPAKLDAFICTVDESMCIMASEETSLHVRVQGKAGKGEKDQALDKGSLSLSHVLTPPEV
ncbi:MAG: hypothetical protein H7A35_03010 [Planctomycetales bacterium]|nr:hypothetical protein [bacterium]UNM09027.1 MAG: hypothetical protein H7A35_03010 [Planctomycetales bacterium]